MSGIVTLATTGVTRTVDTEAVEGLELARTVSCVVNSTTLEESGPMETV